jgi:hypothetical protein
MTVEAIVDELAADIRARAPTKFSADYSATTDFKIGVLIASWRERGEALADIAQQKLRTEIDDLENADLKFGYDTCVQRARAALTGDALIAELSEGDKPPPEPQTVGAGYEP